MTPEAVAVLSNMCKVGHPRPLRCFDGRVLDELQRAGLVRREAGVVWVTPDGRAAAKETA